MSSDYQLEDTIFLPFTTRAFATGIPTALVSGVIDIYEDVTVTPIITAETLTVSLNGHAGFNMITITATSASGFNVGGSYTAILDAGTVDSVSVIGEVVAHFTIDGSAAAQDLANATDGLGAIKTETAAILDDTDLIDDGTSGLAKIATDAAAILADTGTDGVVVNAASLATDAVTEIANGVWDTDATARQTQGTFGQAIGDPIADTTTIYQAVVTDAAGDNVAVDVVAVKAETVLIVADTNELQTDDIPTLIADVPTVSEFNARTLVAASYFDPAADTVATVTAVTNDVGITATAVNLIWDEAMTETTGAPAITGSIRNGFEWMFALSRNKITQTSTTTTLRNDADAADLATSTVSDDATTYTRGEWSV